MSLWLRRDPLVLASKSTVRRTLLEAAGIPVAVKPADVDERVIETASGAARPGDVAVLLAIAKAQAISAHSRGRLVVGADQTLEMENIRFSKPLNRADAVLQLKTLRGRTHQLHSGIAVVQDGKLLYQHVSFASLTMRGFSDSFLDLYLDEAGSAVSQSVGGYQLEKIGIHLFERIQGDQSTILGLPLLPLLAFLRQEGSLA
jgi:septum formation protein